MGRGARSEQQATATAVSGRGLLDLRRRDPASDSDGQPQWASPSNVRDVVAEAAEQRRAARDLARAGAYRGDDLERDEPLLRDAMMVLSRHGRRDHEALAPLREQVSQALTCPARRVIDGGAELVMAVTGQVPGFDALTDAEREGRELTAALADGTMDVGEVMSRRRLLSMSVAQRVCRDLAGVCAGAPERAMRALAPSPEQYEQLADSALGRPALFGPPERSCQWEDVLDLGDWERAVDAGISPDGHVRAWVMAENAARRGMQARQAREHS